MNNLTAAYWNSSYNAFVNNLAKVLTLLFLLTLSIAASASSQINRVSCGGNAYSAAGTDSCSVYLSSKASGSLTVTLQSNNPAVKVPGSVNVRSGRLSTGFIATVASVTTPQSATITAQAGGVTSAFNIALSPATTISTGTLQGLSCADGTFTGPQAGTNPCTITFSSAPASTEAVTLSSSTAQITVPASITVAAGATTANFTAVMNSITTAQIATLTATANGTSVSFNIQLQVGQNTLSVSPGSLSFGNVSLGTAVTKSVTLTSVGTSAITINSASISGAAFTLLGASFPYTLNPGQAMVGTVQFNPTSTGAVTGVLTISSSAPTATVSLSGTGTITAPTVSAITCSSTSITGSLADACTVNMSGAAPTGGLAVSLASSNSAVTVPSSITIPATAASATFIANAACVSSAQAATLTATTGSTSQTISLQLNAAAPALSMNATSIGFGNVVVNSPAVQQITLSSTGSAPLTVNSANVSGAGFSVSGATLPATLNPGQSLNLDVQFDPATAGSFNGQLAIASNASSATVGLSGVGESHEVELSWSSPPASSDPVAGYNIYRAPSGTTSFQRLNATMQTPTTFADGTVQSGSAYDYMVTSVDPTGTESTPSNTTTVTIP